MPAYTSKSVYRNTNMPLNSRVKLHLKRVHLNAQGYTDKGRYFGVGMPLYLADYYDDTTLDRVVLYVRAEDRPAAKKAVLENFPRATFYR